MTTAHIERTQSAVGRRRRQDAQPYRRLVEEVAGQLRAQRRGASPSALAVLPVVGFGEQVAEVLTTTLDLLSPSLGPTAVLLVLVNRPQHQPADSTLTRMRSWRVLHPEAPVVVADVALTLRPRLGELRQLGVDAAEEAWGALPAEGAVLFVDDDIVALPPGTVPALQRRLLDAPLAIGPVLFDHPRLPMALVPELYAGDLLRALLSDLLLERIEQNPVGTDVRSVESLVLSGNLAVRRDSLRHVAGLHDLNELTELTRDVLASSVAGAFPPPARSVTLFGADEDPLSRLRRLAVRMHSRRALAAWRRSKVPTVAQWRAQRLLSSVVDPVRIDSGAMPTPPRLATLPRGDRAVLLATVDEQFAVVLRHLQPHPDEARRALAVLGLCRRDVAVNPGADGANWQVRVHRIDGLVDVLIRLQAADLAGDAEASADAPMESRR